MSKILLKNIDTLITMNEKRTRLKKVSLLINDNKIEKIAYEIDEADAEVIDASNYFVFPGLINTHHHFYQTLTRNIPQIQKAELFDWLKFLYPIWANLTSDALYYGSLVAMGELLKTGCTTASDHFYLFPNHSAHHLIDIQFEAAKEIGIRFYANRGSMSLSEKDGGLPPDSVVQTVDEILKDSQRVIEKYHDSSEFSMSRVVLAPCSPFSVTADLMKESIKLARSYGVLSHTHLAETKDEEEFCLDMFGMRPLEYMEKLGWLGEDVWFAHGIHFTDEEIDILAQTKTGVAHCPASNMKLGSGTAKIPHMLKKGVRVGLAVDGSASNDSSNMILEMRIAYLLHKLIWSVSALSADDILALATNGGRDILHQSSIGSLEEGKAADMFLVNKNRLGFAGGLYDPVSALLATGDTQIVDMTIVNGKIVVKEGKLVNIDENKIIEKANRYSREMVEK